MSTQDVPQVSVVVGSASDAEAIEPCRKALHRLGISHEARVFSAHRTLQELNAYLETLEERGVKLVIAAAGMAAHLPGVVAAAVRMPVIGVPLAAGSLQGLDALLSVAQMPGGVPVACMGIGKAGGKNAAYLAGRILAMTSPEVKQRLAKVLDEDRAQVLASRLPDLDEAR